jgi:hypothetical protein
MSGARLKKATSPRSNLTFYPAEVDGVPAAFLVDLEREPDASLPYRIVVAITMRAPASNGLRAAKEADKLDGVQRNIADILSENYGAELVGFYDLGGTATLVFYAKSKGSTNELKAALEDAAGPYSFEVFVAKDATWRFYIDALFPDAYALQGNWNRGLIQEHEGHGDTLNEPRDVDHLATFASRARAAKAAELLAEADFHVEALGPDEDEDDRFAVMFYRQETLDGNNANRFSQEILDIVLPLGGEYDGWGAAPITKKRTSSPKKKSAATLPAKTKTTAKAPKKTTAKAPKKTTKAKATPAKTKKVKATRR